MLVYPRFNYEKVPVIEDNIYDSYMCIEQYNKLWKVIQTLSEDHFKIELKVSSWIFLTRYTFFPFYPILKWSSEFLFRFSKLIALVKEISLILY